jgi:hypothetical protein
LVLLQIPQQLGQAAASAPDPFSPKSFAAVSALAFFFNKAIEEEALPRKFRDAPNPLAKNLGLQLKQCGFLAALPRLLSAAATALTDTKNDPAWNDVPQILSNTSKPAASAPDAVTQLWYLQDISTWLLLLARESLCFFPQQLNRAAIAVPVLRLSAAAMQLCSRCADQVPAGAAPPPTALEQLLLIAFTAGQAVCAACDHNTEDFDPAVSASADALRAISMLLLVPTVCPEDFYQEAPQIPDCSAAHSKKVKVRLAVRANTSLASWQFACAHESELPAAQQQALRELGCSGRAFMYVAGHALTPVMHSSTVLHLCQALLCVAKHSASSTKASRERLDSFSRRQQLVLAGALSSANNDTPPSDSPMLPCAPLFWLLPTVLLQWADKQPASGPDFTLQHYVLMSLLQVAVTGVLEQQSYWTAAEAAMFEGSGGEAGAFEEQQAMARALYAAVHGGAGMGAVVPASMQGMSPQESAKTNRQRRLFQDAGKKAASFSSDCSPPASCLAQLLRLASNAAARMLASMQAATASSGTSVPGSSNSGPSLGSGSSSAGSSSSTGSRSTGRPYGSLSSHPKPNSFLSESEHIDRALFNLAQALPALLKSSEGWLWSVFFKDTSAARHDPLEGLRAMGIILGPQPGSSSSPWGKDGASDGDSSSSADEQEGMAALCAALQDTIPQLTEAVEAALRRGVGREAYGHLAAVGTSFLRNLTRDPVFVAAGLAVPSNPVLRPLSSLSFTMLKLVNAIHSEPDAGYRELSIASGVSCLETVLQTNSLILRAVCASSSNRSRGGSSSSRSSSSSAAVIKMLVRSRGRAQGSLSEEHLAAISNSTGKPASADTTTSSSSSSSSSSGSGSAVSMVPWLVSLGRCCLGYSMVLQGSYAKATGKAAGRRNLGDRADMRRAFHEVGAVLPDWLHSSSISAQLASAGYATGSVLELLQSAATAQQHAAQTGPAVLAQLLQGLGLALCSMPTSTVCNNPLCKSLTPDLSEQQLVVGSSCRCSGCRVDRYCSKGCQVAHWKHHKPACKAVAAAAAAKTAT